MGGHAVYVQGLSELVRYHQAIFLTPLDAIVPLRPEDTTLVVDTSPEYRQTALYLETLLRRTPPTHDKVTIGHRGALDVMPYQLVPAQQSLQSLRPRILIADGTGLGKTVELGILLTELIKRGRGRRILVVAIRSMLAQLQRELWARFTLPLVRLDSEGLQRVQARIPANRNPFGYFDRCIVSIDTLKNHGMYRAWLEQIRWDVIVVDECHNVANRGSQRSELARLLAAQCDALVLTSATPHNGRAESFANLMRMLDPTSIANPKQFTKEDVKHLYVRRFKKDVEREAGDQLRDRDVATHQVAATTQEEAALAGLHALDLTTLGRKQARQDRLVRWTLIKAFLSSPEACLESLENRIENTGKALAGPDGPHPRAVGLETDLARLCDVKALVEAVRDPGGSKLPRLIAELSKIGFDGGSKSPRVVIFSERIRTLEVLKAELTRAFSLKASAVDVFTASSGDDEKQRALVESFGHADSPLRLLLCSDAASEGVNLHHQCHHLFHFDVPWSLIRLTQRNGRIDRFGQRQTPHLAYLVTLTKARTADQHVVERLIEKEREVERQLGDVGALLGLYDPESEDDFLTRGIARGKSPEELLPAAPLHAGAAAAEFASDEGVPTPEPATNDDVDLLALFAEVQKEQSRTPSLEALVEMPPSLYPENSDYLFLVDALRHLERHPVIGSDPLQWEARDKETAVEIHAPDPFRRHREGFLPREAVPEAGKPYRLVMGRDIVSSKLRAALDEEGRWPDWHLLWEQHPIVEWLLDALGSAYARGEAPLLRVPSLGKGRALFLLQGLMFNHESEAVEARWMGIPVEGSSIAAETLALRDVLEQVGLRRGLVNTGKPPSRQQDMQGLVPAVIAAARDRLVRDRKERVKADLMKRVRTETRRLETWARESLAQIEEHAASWTKRAARVPRHVEDRMRRDRENIEAVKRNHKQLLDSLQASGEPYLRLAAVFSGE